MSSQYQLEEILMAVKTYPTPSAAHGETVCTAGIHLRDGAWVRIYPYPFRLIEDENRFSKWQVIRMPLTKADNDPRPESYKLYDVGKVEVLRSLGTENGTWAERIQHLEPTMMPSVQDILNGIPPKDDQR